LDINKNYIDMQGQRNIKIKPYSCINFTKNRLVLNMCGIILNAFILGVFLLCGFSTAGVLTT